MCASVCDSIPSPLEYHCEPSLLSFRTDGFDFSPVNGRCCYWIQLPLVVFTTFILLLVHGTIVAICFDILTVCVLCLFWAIGGSGYQYCPTGNTECRMPRISYKRSGETQLL
ncbi:hypothetical protein IW261DRAFT_372925 [Armillaria novae-zelandiae]|uniref:Uncharacterized protein n=1 Tax=Armillaria novae-zelandiae TaxID=153914 RepID=A0AA39PS64_9AGAR|nr:hypothetical protein IW261DRAFT_372925 [Armillaria novae-zelandiae]